tara:strand:- start:292 stop:522 length:231 start_codon:yes stop_codon:yes gene_type:complete
MGCYCDRRRGGAGKQNTPYTYHMYMCEFYLNEIEYYSYEQFDKDYKEMEKTHTSEEIYKHFLGLHPIFKVENSEEP